MIEIAQGRPAAPGVDASQVIEALGGWHVDGGNVWQSAWVGSASVPGLAVEAATDLALEVVRDPAPEEALDALAPLGYVNPQPFLGGLRLGHASGRAALIIMSHERAHIEDLQILRDYLTEHPVVAAEYSALRSDVDRKTAFLQEFTVHARAWHVATSGFRPVLDIAAQLRDFAFPWFVTSGWALDLHVGVPSRIHIDVDLSVPRAHQLALRGHLLDHGWRLDVVVGGGKYGPWPEGQYFDLPTHQVHARQGGVLLDVLLAEVEGQDWVFRRDGRIRLPWDRARRVGPLGVPYLAPEVVLLFKSSARDADPRGKDQLDFERVLPSLDFASRSWLHDALKIYKPGHPWLAELGSVGHKEAQ